MGISRRTVLASGITAGGIGAVALYAIPDGLEHCANRSCA